MYLLVSLALTLTFCGGEDRGVPPRNTGIGQVRQVIGESERTPALRSISITPSNPLGINSGTQLQFAAMGSYTDNSVQDLTTLVTWTTSDTSIAIVSNAPDSKRQAKGYCSISATLGSISESTIIGVN